MMLAEMGAEVVRIERPGAEGLFGMTRAQDPLLRGKNFVELDLVAVELAAGLDREKSGKKSVGLAALLESLHPTCARGS